MAGLGHASYEGLQELKGRLPHVPETIIMHFLSQLGGNIEQCYEELKDRKWNEDDFHRPPEDLSSLLLGDPRMRTVSEVTPRTNTTIHPQLKRMMTYPDQILPLDSNQLGLQNTWPASANWHSRTSRPSGGYMTHGVVSPTYPSGFSVGSPGSPSMHSFGPPGLPSMHSNSPPGIPLAYSASPPGLQHVSTATARHHLVSQNPFTGDLTTQQRRQLEHIQKIREDLVHQLSVLKSEADDKKHRLTKLRLEVSEGPTQQDVNSIQDVITTLQYDIQAEKRKIEIQKSQNEMKENREIYTEEGVRWQCGHCTFLNHPLMSRCESCDLPKINSRQGTVQS